MSAPARHRPPLPVTPLRFPARVILLLHVALLLAALFVDSAWGQESQAARLKAIDKRRRELLAERERIRHDREIGGSSRLVALCDNSQKLFMLDYDDPRTRIGGAVAMQDVSDEELMPVLFHVIVERRPQEKEMAACRKHMAEKKGNRRETVHEIVWALCNTKEFVEKLKDELRRAGSWP
jgi:hypothetical protein